MSEDPVSGRRKEQWVMNIAINEMRERERRESG